LPAARRSTLFPYTTLFRSRLVDDAGDVQARDLAGLLGGLPLGVVEVGRDGDDGVADRLAEVSLGVLLQLAEDTYGDLLGGVGAVVDLLLPVGAHVALDGGDGAVHVGDGLTLGHFTGEHLSGLAERHH